MEMVKESVCLAGVAEAVEWAHVLEESLPKGTTRRIIIIIHLLGLAPAGYLTAPDNGR
jgi:hypothetical protein